MSKNDTSHQEKILDQFTRQATKFQASHLSAEAALRLAVEFCQTTADDTVLDVACGPGVLACAFAGTAARVTGIDITPTMIERAEILQAEKKLNNITWKIGDVTCLPFDDAAFSLVVSRYAIHHFENPIMVVKEMARVCRRGGRVALIDSAPAADKAEAFNAAERMRDPSHTRALTAEGLQDLAQGAGLHVARNRLYPWDSAVRALLDRSFPAADDVPRLWNLFETDIGIDRLGMNCRRIGGELQVTFPTLILVAEKK